MKLSLEEEEPLLALADRPSRLTLEERTLPLEELLEEERTLLPELEALELRELLLPEVELLRTLLSELRELLVPEEELLRTLPELEELEEERTLLPDELLRELLELEELRVLLLLEEERLCCWTAEVLPLERELLLLEEERTELPEDRLLELPEDRVLWVEEEPEPVDRLLEEDRLLWLLELVFLLLLEERVWATAFSEASRETTSIREVAIESNLLIASQF